MLTWRVFVPIEIENKVFCRIVVSVTTLKEIAKVEQFVSMATKE